MKLIRSERKNWKNNKLKKNKLKKKYLKKKYLRKKSLRKKYLNHLIIFMILLRDSQYKKIFKNNI
jgi:hypothetical protein